MKQILFALQVLLLISIHTVAQTTKKTNEKWYQQQWKQLETFEEQQLPRSADSIALKIYQQAEKEKQTNEAFKSLIKHHNFIKQYSENELPDVYDDLSKRRTKAWEPYSQLLNAMMAECLTQYYNENRYPILRRKTTASNDDIRQMNQQQIADAICTHIRLSLNNPQLLKTQNIEQYKTILTEGKKPIKQRPSLYDILMWQAIESLLQNDINTDRFEQLFALNDPQLFADAATFAKLPISTSDTANLQYKAVRLMQDLTKLRLSDNANKEALYALELDRINLLYNYYIGFDREEIYNNALKNLSKQLSDSPVSALVAYHQAVWLRNNATKENNNLTEAVEICRKAWENHPKSEGGMLCRDLMQQIVHPSIEIQTEEVYLPGQQALMQATSANCTSLHITITSLTDKYTPQNNTISTDTVLTIINNSTKVFTQTIALPDNNNHHTYTSLLSWPSLKPGRYLIAISNAPIQQSFKGVLSYAIVQVSNLSVSIQLKPNDKPSVIVQNRQTGKAIANATVTPQYIFGNRQKKQEWQILPPVKTNNEGIAAINGLPAFTSFFVTVNNGNDEVVSQTCYNVQNERDNRSNMRIRLTLLTDRRIYRPGQTVYYKAILMQTNGQDASATHDQQVDITLRDANGNDIQTQTLKTNRFGSSTGNFQLPKTGLTGNWTLISQFGSADISVEEYKRPKFEVELSPITEAYRLGDTLTIKGKATSYSGISIANAQGKYKITKQLPYRPYLSHVFPNQNEEEVDAGTFTVGEDGTFNFKLITKTEPKLEDASFNYNIAVDITDINGETQSATKHVRAEPKHANINVSLPDTYIATQDTLKAVLTITNKDNQPIDATGTYHIYRYTPEGVVTPNSPWQTADWMLAPDSITGKFNFTSSACTIKETLVRSSAFNTAVSTLITLNKTELQPGQYKIVATLTDTTLHAEAITNVIVPQNSSMQFAEHLKLTIDPQSTTGDTLSVIIGSIDTEAICTIEIMKGVDLIKPQTIQLNKEQKIVKVPLNVQRPQTITIIAYLLKENRRYVMRKDVFLPKLDNKLNITIETMRQNPTPGGKETIKIKISGTDADKNAAELVATMYDASLDAYQPHQWDMNLFYPQYVYVQEMQNYSYTNTYGTIYDGNPVNDNTTLQNYSTLNWFNLWDNQSYGNPIMIRGMKSSASPSVSDALSIVVDKGSDIIDINEKSVSTTAIIKEARQGKIDKPATQQIAVRRNLNETAFFYPQLTTDASGEITFTYTVPESLTQWHLMMLAHNKAGHTGEISQFVVTAKDLMVTPEIPRFVREKDHLWLKAKISNQTNNTMTASATIEILDAVTQQPINIIKNKNKQDVTISGKGSETVQWEINIPEDHQQLTFRIKASSGNQSDGEEHVIPVLPYQVPVSESLPISINKAGNYEFELTNLKHASSSITHQNLTFNYTQNAAWEILKALPYLMEYPYECSEQVFSRLFGYAMGQTIINNNQNIGEALKLWAKTDNALQSPLKANEELTSLLNEETPWQQAGENEAANRRRLIMLTDENATNQQIDLAIAKLQQMQLNSGAWCWFKGMPEDNYITTHILIGLGHLQNSGSSVCERPAIQQMINQGTEYIQSEIIAQYKQAVKDTTNTTVGSYTTQQLYALSFYTNNTNEELQKAISWFLNRLQLTKNRGTVIEQAMTALVFNRFNKQQPALKIMNSLRQQAITDNNSQAWFRTTNYWHWTGNQVETLSTALEAFNELTPGDTLISNMSNKLVALKRVQAWPTTRSTTMAIWGMISSSKQLFTPITTSDKITIGNKELTQETATKTDLLSGYSSYNWQRKEIKPAMGTITIQKRSTTPTWASMHWSYLVPVNEIKATQGPLTTNRQLFVEKTENKATTLIPIDETEVNTGDRIVVRLTIESSQDMDYIHLKDMRSSLLEPETVLSEYKRQGEIGYYQSVRDASVNFFIHHLPKGIHVIEYNLRVRGKGTTSNGFTSIECMYAPEYEAHSQSIILNTK